MVVMFRPIYRALCAIVILCSIGSCNDCDLPDAPQKEETKERAELPSFDQIEEQTLLSARVMSYNVRNCKGTDNVVDYKRVADVIAAHKVEAVAIQELDSMTTRYPNQDVLKNLAEYTGMYPTFGAAIKHRGGKYGVGVLTREKPISHYTVPLPCSSEPRVLLVVELESYYFCSTHFSLHAEYRKQAVDIIIEEMQKLNKPTIVAGDLNALRSEASIQTLAKHFYILEKQGNVNTFPSGSPTKEIDYICIYKDKGASVVVSESWVSQIPIFSDHRPIVADFTICQ